MLKSGEDSLARIGGRSKSEMLAQYNVKALAQSKNPDSFAQRRIRQVTAQLHKLKEEIVKLIEKLKAPIRWNDISDYLETDEPSFFVWLTVPDSEDSDSEEAGLFKMVGPNGKELKEDHLWKCWQEGRRPDDWIMPLLSDNIEDDDLDDFEHFWSLSLEDRTSCIEQWKKDIMQPTADHLGSFVAELTTLAEERKALKYDGELEILKDARVIGATTSGAAKYRDILGVVAPEVVLVEEAGEVLEAHILTALAEGTEEKGGCQHLIMIGDHMQLRPKVEQYRLTAPSGGGYNLDCSLFERLIGEERAYVTLDVQRRMRPMISALIRAQTYPSLQDHESVHHFPDLLGIKENVVFLDHRLPEDGYDTTDGSKTKSNFGEAELVVEIVKYLLLQGYPGSSIVILTPYLGQLSTLISLVKTNLKEVTAIIGERDYRELEELEENTREQSGSSPLQDNSVRCSSIDNFQGEEADIIVASLVRSNEDGKIGFLKEPQRVNVLLSRARHGMILVGNSATLQKADGHDVWNPILKSPSFEGRVLDGLPTICQLHPKDDPINLSEPKQFRELRPNGGCHRPCTYRLDCGHYCQMMCHPIDRSHEQAQRNCCEPCKITPIGCPSNHPCPKLCKEDCGLCRYQVGPMPLVCGHIIEDVKCYEVNSTEAREQLTTRCKQSNAFMFNLRAPSGHNMRKLSLYEPTVPKCLWLYTSLWASVLKIVSTQIVVFTRHRRNA